MSAAISDQQVPICRFDNQEDNIPKAETLTWGEMVRLLRVHDERPSKDGPLYSPAVYRNGGSRGKANVKAVTLAVADYDHDSEWETVKAELETYEYVAYSTYNYTPEEPRFRVAIPLTRHVSAIEWPEVKSRIDHHVFKTADHSVSDTSRMYYWPSCPVGALRFAEYHQGKALDPDDLPTVPKKRKPKAKLLDVGDAGLIEKAKTSKDGEAFTKLWNGDTSSFDSQSEADLALCGRLAFWTGKDANRMDSLFRQSGLMRDKWERGDYRTKTIEKAIDGCTEVYQPSGSTAFPWTDTGNAERLVHHYGEGIRYCYQSKSWYIWTNKRWEADKAGRMDAIGKMTVRRILKEAADEADDERRKALVGFARKSEADGAIRAMISRARSERGIPILAEQFDANQWLLNVENGTIDLKTGVLLPHSKEHMITKLTPVEYDPHAKLDLWERFLDETTEGDRDLQAFLQRAAGYSLTGDTSEEKLFFVHGPTNTGKSTFTAAVKAAMGEYAQTADFETFLKRSFVGGARNDIADLAGARLVLSIEVDEGKALAEGLIKSLTGGDTVKARHLYQEGFEFRPAFKLWLCANDAPKVSDSDDAMWRRILRVPFERIVPKAKRDPKVKASLTDPTVAGAAILAWGVQGCLDWQKHGLEVPPIVEDATEKLRRGMDPLGPFVSECCILDPQMWSRASDLRTAYDSWAKEQGTGVFEIVRNKDWGDRWQAMECTPSNKRDNAGKQFRIWQGVGLREFNLPGDEPPSQPTQEDLVQTVQTVRTFKETSACSLPREEFTEMCVPSVPSVPPPDPEPVHLEADDSGEVSESGTLGVIGEDGKGPAKIDRTKLQELIDNGVPMVEARERARTDFVEPPPRPERPYLDPDIDKEMAGWAWGEGRREMATWGDYDREKRQREVGK